MMFVGEVFVFVDLGVIDKCELWLLECICNVYWGKVEVEVVGFEYFVFSLNSEGV